MTKKRIRNIAIMTAMSILALGGCGNTESQESGDGTEELDRLAQSILEVETVVGQEGEPEAEGDSASQEGETGTGGNSASQESSQASEAFCFRVNGVDVAPDMDMDAILEQGQLGESKSMYEAPSCAGQGTDYIYDFNAYEIETYPAEDGKNRIAYIILKDDTVSTAEGVDLSMTKEDCIGVYGEAYEESENKLTYTRGNTKLNFILEGENIVSIEYVSAVIG